MAEDSGRLLLVTFQLGMENYGIDIMDVKEIYEMHEIRNIPNAPSYVEGIFNLRGEIIPVINPHKRFHLKKVQLTEDEALLSGFIIINLNGKKIGLMIDKILQVVDVDRTQIQPPPQMISGIGVEYIKGVYNDKDHYLIILDIHKLFAPEELRQIHGLF